MDPLDPLEKDPLVSVFQVRRPPVDTFETYDIAPMSGDLLAERVCI